MIQEYKKLDNSTYIKIILCQNTKKSASEVLKKYIICNVIGAILISSTNPYIIRALCPPTLLSSSLNSSQNWRLVSVLSQVSATTNFIC